MASVPQEVDAAELVAEAFAGVDRVVEILLAEDIGLERARCHDGGIARLTGQQSQFAEKVAGVHVVARARRTVLSVPGSNPRMIEKSRALDADEVFLDLEDAVAIPAKDDARTLVAAALRDGGWKSRTVGVRVNDWSTDWTRRDVIEVVGDGGVDCIVLPKFESPDHVVALDELLTELGASDVGIEAQIESARGLVNVNAIAASSKRMQSLVFGPADFMASLNMRGLVVGE